MQGKHTTQANREGGKSLNPTILSRAGRGIVSRIHDLVARGSKIGVLDWLDVLLIAIARERDLPFPGIDFLTV